MTGPLAGLLRRLAVSAETSFVLRGGLLTRLWAGPSRRITRDLDLLSLVPREEVGERVAAFLSSPVGDGMAVALDSLRRETIWQETAFPGERFHVEIAGEPVQIDVGFGDPLEPPAQWIDYPLDGGPARVLAATPELMVAWKLDGLFERGVRRWLAKDLYDLWLITGCMPLVAAVLRRAVRLAFETHGHDLEATLRLLGDREWWKSDAVRARWAKFRAGAGVDVPGAVDEIAEDVSARFRVRGVTLPR